jgi:hypothetical protein
MEEINKKYNVYIDKSRFGIHNYYCDAMSDQINIIENKQYAEFIFGPFYDIEPVTIGAGSKRLKTMNEHNFYVYYYQKNKFDQDIYNSAMKMTGSEDINTIRLGIDLLFKMDKPPKEVIFKRPKSRVEYLNSIYNTKINLITYNYLD